MEHKQLVIDFLTEKADGMFRWVYCQVVYICGCIPARIQHALADLPETLDETYGRSLREINKVDWEFAHRLFQFVTVASYPLRIEELAELLAFDFKAGPVPKFYEDWRLEDPVDAVLSTCSTLLAIVYGGERIGNVIQFSHFSVKEYLTSARLAESSDTITRRYHISTTPAHTLAAQACLGLLLHLDKDVVTRDDLQKLPLAKYAAEHWTDHARSEDVSRIVEDGMRQLFDPRKQHLAVCIWIHDPEFPWHETPVTERPLPPRGAPLHYATRWGLHSMVGFLVIEHPQDVNSRGFGIFYDNNTTPLHLALDKGHVKIVRFLLECDADVTAQDGRGMTPLHFASRTGRREIADILLERGADVAAKNSYGETPLHLAAERGQVEVASMLIERGADVAAQSLNRETPLHRTAWEGRVEVAGPLIERGADVAAQSKQGETPLHQALHRGHVKFASMLIERGADVTGQDMVGETPLHLASRTGQLEVASMLIERGADVVAQNNVGETPLHLAAREGDVEVAGLFIEHGADVTAQNTEDSTPLHLVSIQSTSTRRLPQQYAEIARILLERGADGNAQDKDGLTPFGLASSDRGIAGVAHVLSQHGAHPGPHENMN